MKITAVIITLNEEKNIGRCLASLGAVVDEVIVVDAGSKDRTREICVAAGATWVEQPWLGYGGQKNFANSLATTPYILSIDADEALSSELSASILAAKGKLRGAYSMNRKTNYCGDWVAHSGWYPDRKVRLFPAGGASWNLSEVHEQLELGAGIEQIHLAGDLHHYSYYTVEEHRERTRKYAHLQAKALALKGGRMSLWHRWVKPVYTFVRVLLLRNGWLDGQAGWNIARISAWGTAERYRELGRIRAKKSQGNAPA
ncbi:MAG: glycosyltransferase family 2 protein [Bacteroidia bacterium]|nr:glycosyltransferase family 2 protein [Bacteroidia bacterium]